MPASIYAWLPEEREDEERKQLLEGLYRELDGSKNNNQKPFENISAGKRDMAYLGY